MAPSEPQSSTESAVFHSGFFVTQRSERQALYLSAIDQQAAVRSQLPDNLNQNWDSLLFNSLCCIMHFPITYFLSYTI